MMKLTTLLLLLPALGQALELGVFSQVLASSSSGSVQAVPLAGLKLKTERPGPKLELRASQTMGQVAVQGFLADSLVYEGLAVTYTDRPWKASATFSNLSLGFQLPLVEPGTWEAEAGLALGRGWYAERFSDNGGAFYGSNLTYEASASASYRNGDLRLGARLGYLWALSGELLGPEGQHLLGTVEHGGPSLSLELGF